jgi:aldehyde dehydrogenase (NAD+)
VLCVFPYDDIDDAVALANDSAYGLAGSVWGPDDEVALAVARRMRTGQVEVNGNGLGGSPFGGFKQSGFGREGGLMGLRSYTETKAIGFPA